MNRHIRLLLPLFLLISAQAQAQDINAGQFCYLPTQSNVEYSSVQELPVISPNEVLAYGKEALQFGELWLPASSAKNEEMSVNHPLVVLVHGGCWLNSYDIRHTHALSTALSQSGYAVWSIEYRRVGDENGGWPGSYEDINAAIKYLPKLSNYPVQLRQVAIVGHSAGGHLALLAGVNKLYDFKAVIGLAAIVDLEKYSLGDSSCQRATLDFMGGTAEDLPNEYRAANPARLDLHELTTLIHGTNDSIVSTKHATSSTARSRVIEGAGHFDMIHPGTQSFRVLLQELATAFRN